MGFSLNAIEGRPSSHSNVRKVRLPARKFGWPQESTSLLSGSERHRLRMSCSTRSAFFILCSVGLTPGGHSRPGLRVLSHGSPSASIALLGGSRSTQGAIEECDGVRLDQTVNRCAVDPGLFETKTWQLLDSQVRALGQKGVVANAVEDG